MTYLMTGATGALGRELLTVLQGTEARVHLGVRRPQALQPTRHPVRHFDYEDPSSMLRALEGVSTLLLISSNAPLGQRVRHHSAVIDAATRAGVQRLVYTSFVGAGRPGESTLLGEHHSTERLLRASSMDTVILRNPLYLDALPNLFGPFRDLGMVAHPGGKASSSWMTRRDIATFMADVLFDTSLNNLTLDLSSTPSHSLPELIDMLAAQTGCPIEYRQPSPAEYQSHLAAAGLDPALIFLMEQMFTAMRSGALLSSAGLFEDRLGRAPESAREYIARTF